MVARLVFKNQVPVLLGGEHTLTVGAVKGAQRVKTSFGVVQFDAHADLRTSYRDNPLNHACVMRRVMEMGIPIFQVGVRSLSRPEQEFREKEGIPSLDAVAIARTGIPESVLPSDFPSIIYISIDVDAFDPAVIPATGTPEPGGLSWYDTIQLLEKVISGRSVIGMDFVELAPVPGLHASEFTVAKLVYAMMGMILA